MLKQVLDRTKRWT